jgi:uncharacterized protein (DUF2252 family)
MTQSPLSDRTHCPFPVALREALNNARERATVLQAIFNHLHERNEDADLRRHVWAAVSRLKNATTHAVELWREGQLSTPAAVRVIDDAREASRAAAA